MFCDILYSLGATYFCWELSYHGLDNLESGIQ